MGKQRNQDEGFSFLESITKTLDAIGRSIGRLTTQDPERRSEATEPPPPPEQAEVARDESSPVDEGDGEDEGMSRREAHEARVAARRERVRQLRRREPEPDEDDEEEEEEPRGREAHEARVAARRERVRRMRMTPEARAKEDAAAAKEEEEEPEEEVPPSGEMETKPFPVPEGVEKPPPATVPLDHDGKPRGPKDEISEGEEDATTEIMIESQEAQHSSRRRSSGAMARFAEQVAVDLHRDNQELERIIEQFLESRDTITDTTL